VLQISAKLVLHQAIAADALTHKALSEHEVNCKTSWALRNLENSPKVQKPAL